MSQPSYCMNCGNQLPLHDAGCPLVDYYLATPQAAQPMEGGRMRNFATGATRDDDSTKPDYEGFLSPLVIEAYGRYMHKHRQQADGKLRDSDNWQKGIPKDAYIKSGWRHFMDWWREHRGLPSREGLVDALCALLFNVMGYLHEVLKEQQAKRDAVQRKLEWVKEEEERLSNLRPLAPIIIKSTPQQLVEMYEDGRQPARAVALAAEQAKAA